MNVRRILFVVASILLFSNCAEAQLFRFRQRPAPYRNQYPSNYDAKNYRYSNVQPQTKYIPSGQTNQDEGASRIDQQQLVLVPVTEEQRRTLKSSEVVMVTMTDPDTGRIVRKPYRIQEKVALRKSKDVPSAVALTPQQKDPASLQASAAPIAVTSPSTPGSIVTSSFDSPTVNSANKGVQYSVFSSPTEAVPSSATDESPLPILEPQISDDSGRLELDLPPLKKKDE